MRPPFDRRFALVGASTFSNLNSQSEPSYSGFLFRILMSKFCVSLDIPDLIVLVYSSRLLTNKFSIFITKLYKKIHLKLTTPIFYI